MCSMTEAVRKIEAVLAEVDEPLAGPGHAAADDYIVLRGLAERLAVDGLRRLAALDAGGIGATDGSVSTAAWVRRHTGGSARAAAGDVRLARRLHTDSARPLTTTATLLDEGRLTVEHARAIARATATMPTEAFAVAEPVVAATSADLPADAAAQVATQICQHATEMHGYRLDDPLASRRAAAEAGRHLHLSPCGDMWALDALLMPDDGQALKAVLDALAQPALDSDELPDLRTAAQRRADALGDASRLLLASDRLPTHGGRRPQVSVLIDLVALAEGRGGWWSDGTAMTPAETRLATCDARLDWVATRTPDPDCGKKISDSDRVLVREALARVPPALGGLPTQILDAGRTERTATFGQRHVLAVRDRGCGFPGCDRPPEWCDAHHLVHWVDGGPTDLDNLLLLCRRHHTAIHKDGWQLTRAEDGTVVAVRPR